MPRYVILEHDHPVQHWDFLLEDGASLLTWRLAAFPQVGESIQAVPLGNHRLAYLDYQGAVSGGRGQVIRREQGQFAWSRRDSERYVVQLTGLVLQGTATISRDSADRWSFVLHCEKERL